MVSIKSVIDNLEEVQSRILILLQEGDVDGQMYLQWDIYDAYEHVQEAIRSLGEAELDAASR